MNFTKALAVTFLLALTKTVSATEFTAQEKNALSEFRKMVDMSKLPQPYMKEDDYLIRWIRTAGAGGGGSPQIHFKFRNSTSYSYVLTKGTGFDLEKAKENLEDTLKWRKENNIDNISFLKEDFSDLKEKYPYNLETSKKDGKTILLVDWGKWNLKSLAEEKDPARIQRYVYNGIEEIATYARNKNSHHISFLADAKEATTENHACPKCKLGLNFIIGTFEKRFPELIKRHVNINSVPEVFNEVQEQIALNLSPLNKEELKVFDDNAEVYLKELDAFIERDQIPNKFIQNARQPLTKKPLVHINKPPSDWLSAWKACGGCNVN